LVTIDSLVLLAAAIATELPVLSIINAYKNMVYFGIFEPAKNPEPIYQQGPTAVPVQRLANMITQDVVVVGDGFETYQKYLPESLKIHLHRNSQFSDHPQAETLGLLAEKRVQQNKTIEWNSFVPLYIRASEAEENKRGILISPLK
jgi:N6-L-threonylcarbamoyladenine synthase/tRNA threonylcarbamoyladenosine biosynthesis protein TsaB